MGFIGDLFTKTPQAKTKLLNEIINETAMNTIVEVGSKASGSIVQEQTIKIVGVTDSSVSGIVAIQNAKISIASITDSSTNLKLMEKMTTDLINNIKNKRTDFPELTPSSADVTISNAVKNAVTTNFSSKSLNELSLQVKQKQGIEIGSIIGSNISDIQAKQTADALGQQVNKMANAISSQLIKETSVTSTATTETTNFLTDITKTVGDTMNTALSTVSGMFGLDISTIIMIGLVLIVLIIAGVYIMDGDETERFQQSRPYRMPPPPSMQYAPPVPPPPTYY